MMDFPDELFVLMKRSHGGTLRHKFKLPGQVVQPQKSYTHHQDALTLNDTNRNCSNFIVLCYLHNVLLIVQTPIMSTCLRALDHLDQSFLDFLVKHKLLNSSQHGFLKARSCLTNMLCFFEEITKWIDVGSPVDVIYLDFQKAFDKVPHQRLLLKLKAHGIGDSITDWIEQWLTDRRQRVVVDGEVSNWKSVLSGVPQGSVLGPILFLIYINDLDDNITSNVLKFADDTKLFRKVNTDGDQQHLQNDLDRLVKWSEKWQMLFNFGKCKCLHTGHGNLNPPS